MGHVAQTPAAGEPTQMPQKIPSSRVTRSITSVAARGKKNVTQFKWGGYKDREEAVATQNQLSRQFPNASFAVALGNKIYRCVRMPPASKDEAKPLVRRPQQTRWNKPWVASVPCSWVSRCVKSSLAKSVSFVILNPLESSRTSTVCSHLPAAV